ncbi:MAG TPA: pre-peptidase C-terminal domain-containing protein [Anaerolineae bacterium]|nr:pre-peptidase C-terminal domain-containing protein [Anaerolineae bacterium]
MRRCKLDVVISIVAVATLLLNGLLIGMPVSSAADAPPPPSSPTPSVPPVEVDIAGQSRTPPSPDNLPAEVEEARARQAIEDVLEKYLRYWGPRYEVSPIDVTVSGEWAQGVAEPQGEARTLSGPIHILAHRLPDGSWQALLPSTDGLYLQWLYAMPERLVPASQKGQLRTEAAEADALRPLQATPAVPPAVTVTLPSMEGPAQPTATPTALGPAPATQPTAAQAANGPGGQAVIARSVGDSTLIYLVDLACGAEQQIAEEPFETLPLPMFERFITLSPNGQFVTYVTADDLGMRQSRLWLITTETRQRQLLATFEDNFWIAPLAWSPESNRLAFVKTSGISPSGIELWILDVSSGEQTLVVSDPSFRPALFYGVPREVVRWSTDGASIVYTDYGADDGAKIEYEVDLASGSLRRALRTMTTEEQEQASILASLPCGVSQFDQHYTEWQGDIMQTCGKTIGQAGCALTSQAMVFRYYGVETSPRTLNQCAGTHACDLDWAWTSSNCSGGKVTWNGRWDGSSGFPWATMEGELNAGRPPILRLTSSWDHFVVVVSGSGSSMGGYTINDPWDGQVHNLSAYSAWSPTGLRYHGGTPWCSGQTHLECRDNYCRKVDGAGTDQCSPEGSYCGPLPCSPNADQVALYTDTGYNGSCVTLGVGDYPNPGYLGSLGNDNAESIKVGSNVKAILYEHNDYLGRSETFTGDDSYLWDNYIDGNVVSSVKVQWRTQPPSAPALLSPGNGATFNEGQSITLSWSATGDEYYGEVLGGPGGTLTFGWQSGTSKNIGSQWAGYLYSWHVKARNSAGDSGWSSLWTFTVKPAAPSNLSAQAASCSQVNLYWDDISGNEEGYKIYRNGSYVGQVGADTRTYQNTGLSENTSYSYYVKAFRGSIMSDASNTVNISTPACPPPQPDLRPYAPSGYPYPVVPSSVVGTHEVNTLHAAQPTFFDWHFINSGNATASGSFHVELWVDSTRYVRYPYSSCVAGGVRGFDDWMETVATRGWHTVRLITDPDNTIAESDETNNVWEREFYWAPSAPLFDDMESGTNDWTATGLWHQVHPGNPYGESHSGSHSWWYGQDSTGDYDTGSANSGDLTSPSIYIPTTGYYLRFWYRYETETQGPDWDTRWVQISVDGGPFSDVLQLRDDPMNWWLQSPAIDLSGYAGHAVQVRFRFDTINASFNEYRGWYIDDFEISATPPPSCADAHEPNNGWTEATSIAYGQTLNADICPGGDYDFYTFTGSAGDKVVVDIDAKVDGSSLDSYVFLLDSNGTTVLAEHDDEIRIEVQDSLLGYHLPHNGTYYIKVRAWRHPSVGGTDYFYTIHLFTDDTNPSSAEIVSPVNHAWLDPTLQTVSASATDNGSGVNRVEFLWHDADWENSDWIWLGSDQDGRDGWSFDFDTSPLPEQRGGAFYIWAFDWVGNWTGDGCWNLGIDHTPPTAFIDVSPMYGDAPFVDFSVWWGGSDNLSGISTYDVQGRLGSGGTWTDLFTDTTNTYDHFIGVDGNIYYFRVRARDQAGNLGDYSDGNAFYTVEVCPVAPDEYEADDDWTAASWITTDGISQTHNFHAEANEDWVRFIAFAGYNYTLATSNAGGHADTVLYLYASDGATLVDWNDDDPDNWPASRLEWQPSLSGLYYLKVNHWDQYAYGCTTEYGLAISSDLEAMHIAHLPLGLRNR